ncbi:mitochondrial carrier domain-containing protein [Thermoascus aurantiacus ATCC 26904]
MSNGQASPWESVVAGTAAAILADVMVYPLDVVKTRLQVQVRRQKKHGDVANNPPDDRCYNSAVDAIRQILRHEGISGLYSGLGSSVLSTASLNFTYFYWSAVARTLYQLLALRLRTNAADDSSNSIVTELGLGAAGGAMAQLCTNPVAVVVTRQQTRELGAARKSIWETLTEIVQGEDGWRGLWKGLKVNLILVVNPMITYGVYQWLRGNLLRVRRELRPVDAFVLGALSKVLATIFTHPLIVAKAMLQADRKPSDDGRCGGGRGRSFGGFTEVLLYICRHEGFLRLYKGLGPQLAKGFLVQGIMMMTKERYV